MVINPLKLNNDMFITQKFLHFDLFCTHGSCSKRELSNFKWRFCLNCQALAPKPPNQHTTPTHPPPTFKQEGRVPHKNPKSKTDLEWSPQPIQYKKFQVDDNREYTWQSNMSKENIINLISFNQYCQAQALLGSLSSSGLVPFPNP